MNDQAQTASDYTSSAACQLLATHCACCGKPLVDSDSVETGVGPVCRKKHGYGVPTSPAAFRDAFKAARELAADEPERYAPACAAIAVEDAHKAANVLTHRAALVQGTAKVYTIAAIIHALGYHKLAERITTNAGAIRVETAECDAFGPCLKVVAPYSPAFNQACKDRKVWSRWSKADKARFVALKSRKALWEALSDAFGGMAVIGSKGIKTLPKAG